MSIALQRKLKALRGEMSLDSLAQATGISKSYLWEIENRKVPPQPSAEKLSAIANVFNVTVDFLIEESSVEPADKHLDEAFFRNYKSLDPEDKEHVRKILQTFRKS